MDITQLLNGPLGKQIMQGIGNQTGTNEQETASVIQASIPVLMGMLQQNSSSQEGANSLLNALNEHDGSILKNISTFLNSGDTSDGNDILGHILGANKSKIEKAISEKTNVPSAQVGKIIALLAPILMGFLGQEKKSQNPQSGGGLSDLLGGLMGGNETAASIGGTILSNILKQQGGQGGGSLGGILDTVTGGNQKGSKGGGLAGALGSLLGKK